MSSPTVTPKELRKFGLVVGGIFMLLAFVPMVSLRGGPHLTGLPMRTWAIALGGVLVLFGAVYPPVLALPYRAWMFVGEALGWVNTRVILGAVFFLVMTPLGTLRRALGKDPLHRSFDRGSKSYRVERTSEAAQRLADPSNLSNPF